MIEGTKLKVNEKERIYDFGLGDKVILKDVFEVVIRPSGTHRVKTKDKKMHIISPDWIHIKIN